jgi:hypothetical protein
LIALATAVSAASPASCPKRSLIHLKVIQVDEGEGKGNAGAIALVELNIEKLPSALAGEAAGQRIAHGLMHEGDGEGQLGQAGQGRQDADEAEEPEGVDRRGPGQHVPLTGDGLISARRVCIMCKWPPADSSHTASSAVMPSRSRSSLIWSSTTGMDVHRVDLVIVLNGSTAIPSTDLCFRAIPADWRNGQVRI